MKKHIFLSVSFLLIAGIAVFGGNDAGKKQNYIIGFYNLENLFDTYNDPVKNDEEFLPDGKNQWSDVKYQKKLHNMATVIRSMAQTNGRFHTLLGVSVWPFSTDRTISPLSTASRYRSTSTATS